jgi:tRNA (cmo5U34)-methyltransferase
MTTSASAAQKFDPARAGEYEQQSRIALAGYDACHELSACMLAAALGSGTSAQILVAGAGGGAREVVTAGLLEPNWRFTAVDPSQPMMDIAVARLKPGAPLILAGNRYAYASQPLLLAAWGERWRMQGATPEEVQAKLGNILQGADPPHSE